jgi:hypothetical protein
MLDVKHLQEDVPVASLLTDHSMTDAAESNTRIVVRLKGDETSNGVITSTARLRAAMTITGMTECSEPPRCRLLDPRYHGLHWNLREWTTSNMVKRWNR